MAGTTFKTLAKAHDAVTVAAGGDFLTSRALKQNGMLTVFFVLDSATKVQLAVTATSDDTGSAVEELIDLNGGATITAGVPYSSLYPATKGETIILRNNSTGATSRIRVAKLILESPVG